MPRRRDERPRVLGPTWIPSRKRWRIVVITPQAPDPKERRTTQYHREEADAIEVVEDAEKKIAKFNAEKTGEAITRYMAHLQNTNGTGAVSRKETERRLRLFFPDVPVSRITEEKAKKYYAEFQDGKSVDYHRNTLAEAKSFMRWCVTSNLIAESPLEHVDGVGKRKTGKPQLTGNEARRFLFAALWRAEGGDLGALGCAMALLMALRQKDISRRVVRDLDLEGTVLRVSGGKTKKSNRPRRVPLVLQEPLRRLAEGRSPLEPLFPTHRGGFHTKTWLRKAAKRVCDSAGVPYVCPHGLKGTAGTLAIEAGATADQVADFLSHEDKATTQRHYIAPGVEADAAQGRALRVIEGGRRNG